MHPFTATGHAGQTAKEHLGCVIRHFRDQIHHSLLQSELFASRHHAHRVVEGIAAHATQPTLEITTSR